jgi:peptidoglycan/xylan/chitin deacetylase (PgdA/CDA1 family)
MSRSGALALVLCGACVAPSPPVAQPRIEAPPAPVSSRSRRCHWPDGAKAAVSLTYDDALGSQLEFALPVLEQRGLAATFFLSGPNMARFAGLAHGRHELASHTLKHPCNAELAALDSNQMAAELDAGIAAVRALGGPKELSFAYPCGETRLNGAVSYVPLVRERFVAARGVVPDVADPEHVDLFEVPAMFPPTSSDGSDVVAFIEHAQRSEGWAVVGVHGVTAQGEYLQLSQAAHDRITSYLAAHRAEVWTAPFGQVAKAVAACRKSAAGG